MTIQVVIQEKNGNFLEFIYLIFFLFSMKFIAAYSEILEFNFYPNFSYSFFLLFFQYKQFDA